jgi:MOSC domain-containing protein YiiM
MRYACGLIRTSSRCTTTSRLELQLQNRQGLQCRRRYSAPHESVGREALPGLRFFSAPLNVTIRQVAASILKINISRGGVPKRPVPQAVVTPLGIDGDVHAHPEVHGGPDKALLLITSEGIEELQALGYPLFHGALGENLTTLGLDRRSVRIKQRYRIGEIVIELSEVRSPCKTIKVYGSSIGKAVYDDAVHNGDATSPRWGLGGFYAAVITPGTVRAGDSVELLNQ